MLSPKKLYFFNFSIIITAVIFIVSLYYFYPASGSNIINNLTESPQSNQLTSSPAPAQIITPTPTPTPIPVSIAY